MTRADNKFAEYVMELDYSSIGPSVYAGNISSSVLSDIMAISRRAFRRQDVIVYVGIDMDEDAEDEKYPRYMYNFIMDILDYE